jgi:hypothetical protein
VFPSNAQLEHDAPGTFAGPNDPAVVQDGGAAIQVGQLVLVYVTNPGELDPLTAADVRPVVTGTGGTLLAGPGA